MTKALTNNGYIQVGANNYTLAADDTISAGSLVNSGTIQLYGSSSFTAKLAVASAATQSGTLDIDSGGAVDVTNATGVFTQAAGTTAVYGALSAPTVDVTGGTLDGTGTVTGVVSNSGGDVVGGTLNYNSPGVLSVVGAYQSSGTGTLIDIVSGTG